MLTPEGYEVYIGGEAAVAGGMPVVPDILNRNKDDEKNSETTNKKGVGGKGWRGDKTWKENVNKVKEGGAVRLTELRDLIISLILIILIISIIQLQVEGKEL